MNNQILSQSTVLVVVDVQGKLASLVEGADRTIHQIIKTIKAAGCLNIPILLTEQVPEKIGTTIDSIKQNLWGITPITKSSFSCFQEAAFKAQLRQHHYQHVVLVGIETHVCVYQTACDLLQAGYRVTVIADAVSSRHGFDHQLALADLRQAGVKIISTEMILCQWLQTAKHPRFKDVMAILKG